MANEKRLIRRPPRAQRSGLLIVTVCVWLAVLAVAISDARAADAGVSQQAGERLARKAREAAAKDKHGNAVAAALAAIAEAPSLESELALMLGNQLTWQERAAEAVPWYRRHLEHHPGDREGRLGLARALSWSDDLAGASEVYGELCTENPDDIEARLGLARMEAWSGRHAAAGREYARAREADPDSDEAVLGLARARNHRGRHRDAEQLLIPLVESGSSEGRVELARARWWMGEADAALRTLGDADEELAASIRYERRPRFELFVEHWIDADDQELQTVGVSGERGLARGVRLFGELAHETVDEPGIDEISSSRATAGAAWRRDRRFELNVRATAEDVGRSLQRSQVLEVGAGETVRGEDVQGTEFLWDTWATWTPLDWTRLDAGAARVPVRTPRSRARGIQVDVASLSADQRLHDAWIARAGGAIGSYSDDNRRISADLGLETGPHSLAPTVRAFGATGVSWFEFRDSPDHGYYSPPSYDSVWGGLRLEIDLSRHVSLEGDVRITSEREDADDRFGVASGGATLRWTPPGSLAFAIFARNSTSRFDTDAGYGRRGLGASIILVP